MRSLRRYWWALPLALFAAGLLIWQMPADRLRPTFIAAIERGLNRKVEVNGRVSFEPWRLGVSLEDVVIHDDPRFGLEPLAYVDTLEATIRWTALLAGRFEIAQLRLIDPSVNLAQSPEGWNFPALLNQAVAASRTVAPPEVELSGGGGVSRLNIRFGENKSPYYIYDLNLTLEPGSKPGELSIYFDGVPARTDRSTRGFGRLSGRGTVGLTGDHAVNISLSLARSAASELLLLFQDRGSSVAGFFSGTAHLSGPLNDINVEAKIGLHEFERWGWLMSRGANGPGFAGTGKLNWDAQTLHLETTPKLPSDTPAPVALTVDADRLLGAALWRSHVSIHNTPASALEQVAQQFGFTLPGGTQLMGELDGEVGYATGQGLSGNIDFGGGTLSIAGKQAQVEPTSIHFQGTTAKLAPVTIRQDSDVVRLEASYETAAAQGLSWAFSGKELDLGRAREWGVSLPGRIESGKWKGTLRYEAATGGWQGEGDLSGASLDAEGLNAKVTLASAHVKLEGARFGLSRIVGDMDGVPLHGDFQYDPEAPLRSQLRAQLGAVTMEQLRAWVAPTLDRQPSVLSRTLGIGAGSAPIWVPDRRLGAQLQLDSLAWDGLVIGPLSARLEWMQGVARIVSFTGPARMHGSGEIILSAPESDRPSSVEIENIPWRSGLAKLALSFDLQRGARRAKFTADVTDMQLMDTDRPMQAHIEGELDGAVGTASFDQIELHPRVGDDGPDWHGSGQTFAKGDWEWMLRTADGKSRRLQSPGLAGPWREGPPK